MMLKFISKFPFFKIEKSGYIKVTVNNKKLTDHQKEMIKFITGILSINQIPINKIRFVFTPTFLYDIDNNSINPIFQIMIPNYPLRKHKPIIEIDKPVNSTTIKFVDYINIDDHQIIKPIVKASKKGVVMYINESNFDGIVGACNLDVCIAHHNQFLENFEYIT